MHECCPRRIQKPGSMVSQFVITWFLSRNSAVECAGPVEESLPAQSRRICRPSRGESAGPVEQNLPAQSRRICRPSRGESAGPAEENLPAQPRRGGKIIAGGASPRIGCCIEGAPAGAKDLCPQAFSAAPPGLRADFGPNPGLAPGAIIYPPLRGLARRRSGFRDRNRRVRCIESRGFHA